GNPEHAPEPPNSGSKDQTTGKRLRLLLPILGFEQMLWFHRERHWPHKNKGRLASPLGSLLFVLLCRQFFGLPFVAHEFERPLGFFVGLRDLLLHLLCSLFHFRRETHVSVVFHPGTGRNQAADDDVFLQTAQVVHRSLNRSFGEHSRGLLERR